MYITNIVESSISSLNLFDKNGQKISSEQIILEYYFIRSYLLENYNENDIVGIYLEKDYKYVLVLLACMSIHLTYIPLSHEWPEERILQIQKLSSCKILTEEVFKNIILADKTDTSFDNELLYIMFTSGSTGAPKGVKISRSSYSEFLSWTHKYFHGIFSSDRMLMTTDFTFDISLLDIALLLTRKISLFMSNFNNNIFKLLYELESYNITVHSTVPYNYLMIMQDLIYEKANLSSLKHIILAGARFPHSLYNNFKHKMAYCSVYNAYGPTEGTIYCTIQKFEYLDNEVLESNVSIGKALHHYQLKILEDELMIAGPQVMLGYYNDKEKTNEVMLDIDTTSYYKTGDLVLQNSVGNYFVVGRKDDTIKVAGYRVNLSDIDAYLMQLDYVINAATVAIDDKAREHKLLAYLIINTSEKSIKEIKNDLAKSIPSYQIPNTIKIVDTFPLSSAGKVCKRTLKQEYKG